MQLSLNNVINVSVAEAQAGVGKFNTSNLSVFTREVPNLTTFGSAGYKIYLDPTDAVTDFGSASVTADTVTRIFAQQPNPLEGGGYVVVILFADTPDVAAVQQVSFSSVPASGTYELKYGADTTTALAYNADAAAVQTALRLLTGLAAVTVVGDYAAGFTVTFNGVAGPATLMLCVANSLQDATPANVNVSIATTTPGSVLSTETLVDAITRTKSLVQYFGVMVTEYTAVNDMLAAATLVQSLQKIAFFGSRYSADIAPGGALDQLRTGGFTQSRGLYYGGADDLSAIQMVACYAGRALSTDFTGSNTTSTMHLKDLKTIQPDPTITQTLLDQAVAAGADSYPSLQGVAKVFTSGANKYFDRVYNLLAFICDLVVSQFNYLATTATKIPQTEEGMDGFKSASRVVCKQYRTNAFIAPGTWTSPTTFGNQADFLLNISQQGFYIFSEPISEQLQAAREARQAPLTQIAIKEAGAIQSGNTIVYVNA